jgi:hypothetical protein
MHHAAVLLLVVASTTVVVPAQSTLVAPPGLDIAEGDSNNAFPWNRGNASMRIQFVYDSSTFTSQGVTTPIRITRLRYRADALTSSWSGGSYGRVQIDMSTCPLDYHAVTATFANNNGPDLTTVRNGPVPALLCLQFYCQPLVLDATANPLGLVTGDAWAGLVGH